MTIKTLFQKEPIQPNHIGVSQQTKMMQGTAWLTAGNFISRLLGAIYIIPWYIWMGKVAPQANALFTMGYNIYAWFLLISTVGIPVAVAKQISKYNATDRVETSYHLIKQFLKLMFVTGIVFAIFLYLLSPLFATLSGDSTNLVPVIRSLTLAVLVFPSMSVLRGVFQGFNNLKPYAMSQMAEQLIRVIWMLLTAFFIMKLGSKNYVSAVTQSTFAAFIGMFASLAVLFYFLWKYDILRHLVKKEHDQVKIDTPSIIKETVKEAIPFIVTGSAIQIFQIIDQITFTNLMTAVTHYSNKDAQIMFSYFSANPNKIVMILIAVATAIAGVGIPLLTENFVKEDKIGTARLIMDNLQMLFMFLLPIIIGATILAKPLYTVFYGASPQLAINLFRIAIIQTIFLGFYTVMSPMLQAIFQNRKAVYYFLYGLLLKLVLQVPFILLFHAYGPLLATTLAILLPIVLIYRRLHEVTRFNHLNLMKRALLIVLLSLIMTVVVVILHFVIGLVYTPKGRIGSLLYLVIIGGVGGAIYGYLTLGMHILDKIIGVYRADNLRKKLHL